MKNRKPQINDICLNCKNGKLQYMYEYYPYSKEYLWCKNCNSTYELNHKILWQEDINSISCDMIDVLEKRIKEAGMTLDDNISDKIYDKIVNAIGVLGIEEYKNHN